MRTEQAINNWQDWQVKPPCKPEIIGAMDGGLSNRSFLLNADGLRMVLRINANGQSLPGIDRHREAKIWRVASQAGISPQLLHAEPAYLVSEFVASERMANTAATEAMTDQAISLIRQCHALEVDVANLDYAAHIQRYWDLIDNSGLSVDESLAQQKLLMQDNLEALLLTSTEVVLCHHDPVKANFIGSAQRLFLIDWEYAAKGVAVMDFAALAVEWGVDDRIVLDGTHIQPETLNQAKRLYEYMCQLWVVAQGCSS